MCALVCDILNSSAKEGASNVQLQSQLDSALSKKLSRKPHCSSRESRSAGNSIQFRANVADLCYVSAKVKVAVINARGGLRRLGYDNALILSKAFSQL